MEEEKQELIQAEQKPEVTPAEPEKKKKEKKKKHATRKLSLSKRIFIEFAFAGLALALFTSFVGEHQCHRNFCRQPKTERSPRRQKKLSDLMSSTISSSIT